MKRVAVVLVHFGMPEVTRACLASLADLEHTPHTVIVVDNGPPPGLENSLVESHPDFQVVSSLDNPGFAAGCNAGARLAFEAGAEAVWFLNNDARLEAPLLATLLDQAQQHPEVALWGTQQRDGARLLGCDRQPAWYGQGAIDAPVDGLAGGRVLESRESLSGASLFITRSAWDRLGPWPESYFLYFEDTAWCLRAHRAGLPMVLLDAAVLHSPGTTTGRRSSLTLFYGTRNRLRLQQEASQRSRFGMLWVATYLLQRRMFRGHFRALRPVLDGCIAAFQGQERRSPKY